MQPVQRWLMQPSDAPGLSQCAQRTLLARCTAEDTLPSWPSIGSCVSDDQCTHLRWTQQPGSLNISRSHTPLSSWPPHSAHAMLSGATVRGGATKVAEPEEGGRSAPPATARTAAQDGSDGKSVAEEAADTLQLLLAEPVAIWLMRELERGPCLQLCRMPPPALLQPGS